MAPQIPFCSIFKNAEPFNFKGINTAKYFYDLSVTSSELGSFDAESTLTRNRHGFLAKPLLVVSGILRCLRLMAFSRDRVIFFNNENRVARIKDRFMDLYNFNILHDLGPTNALVIQERHDAIGGKIFSPVLVMEDLTPLLFVLEKVLGLVYKKDIHSFLAALGGGLEQAGFSLQAAASRLMKFYARFLFYRFFLHAIKPRSVILICHYSKHAFMAACRRLGIRTLELQHGHILVGHPYYNVSAFSASMRDAFRTYFTPDNIAVYGDFWKSTLAQGVLFESGQIVTIGYYQRVPGMDAGSDAGKSGNPIILITSNPQVQQDMIRYIQSIKPKIIEQDLRIIIKPHPVELDSAYQSVVDGEYICMDHRSIHQLMPLARCHISVASSTLFDALVYDLDNYVLFVDRFQAACQEILAMRVASRLDLGQLPGMSHSDANDRRYFMDTYDYCRVKDLVEG